MAAEELEDLDEDVLDAIYDLTTLEKVALLATSYPHVTFWLYHSATCRPPRCLAWGGSRYRSNITLRPDRTVLDGRLLMLDVPISRAGSADLVAYTPEAKDD